MSDLFKNFQSISYQGVTAKNLLQRIQIARNLIQKISSFYPYYINEGERPDHIAEYYYGDSSYIWLVYLSNDIIDPQYSWPLSDRQILDRLIDKYGSLEDSQQHILYYYSDLYTHKLSPLSYSYLDNDEKLEWSPKDAFSEEFDINESKRSIRLVSRKLLNTIDSELQTIFKGNVV